MSESSSQSLSSLVRILKSESDTVGESDEDSSIENLLHDEEETESRYDNDEGDRKNCEECENGVVNLAYLSSCPKCSRKDFYEDVHQCRLCDSPLTLTHDTVFCSLCPPCCSSR